MIVHCYFYTCDACGRVDAGGTWDPQTGDGRCTYPAQSVTGLYREPAWPMLPYGWRLLDAWRIVCPDHKVEIDGREIAR